MREQEQRKVSFQGTIKSVQPRSNVWRYRLDNRTHSMTGYNLFLSGIADGEERDFAIAISEKQQEKYKFHLGYQMFLSYPYMIGVAAGCLIRSVGAVNVSSANGHVWPMLRLNIIGE